MPTPVADLRASLEAHNAAFSQLVNLIPAKYYVQAPDHDEIIASKFQKHSKKEKESKKKAVKEAKEKAKRDKVRFFCLIPILVMISYFFE